eukprot:2723628-Lingulodinium_polyedra.AAC.1
MEFGRGVLSWQWKLRRRFSLGGAGRLAAFRQSIGWGEGQEKGDSKAIAPEWDGERRAIGCGPT